MKITPLTQPRTADEVTCSGAKIMLAHTVTIIIIVHRDEPPKNLAWLLPSTQRQPIATKVTPGLCRHPELLHHWALNSQHKLQLLLLEPALCCIWQWWLLKLILSFSFFSTSFLVGFILLQPFLLPSSLCIPLPAPSILMSPVVRSSAFYPTLHSPWIRWSTLRILTHICWRGTLRSLLSGLMSSLQGSLDLQIYLSPGHLTWMVHRLLKVNTF